MKQRSRCAQVDAHLLASGYQHAAAAVGLVRGTDSRPGGPKHGIDQSGKLWIDQLGDVDRTVTVVRRIDQSKAVQYTAHVYVGGHIDRVLVGKLPLVYAQQQVGGQISSPARARPRKHETPALRALRAQEFRGVALARRLTSACHV